MKQSWPLPAHALTPALSRRERGSEAKLASGLLVLMFLLAALAGATPVRGQAMGDGATHINDAAPDAAAAVPSPEASPDAASEPTTSPAASPEASPAPEGAAETKPHVARLSLLDLFLSGGWLMWPLAFCSLIELALVVDRFAALRLKLVIPPGFMDGLTAALGSSGQDLAAARTYCTTHDAPITRVVLAGLRKAAKGENAAQSAMEDAGAAEIARLRTNVRHLHGISVVAPMMGLLGTVQGMIEAFHAAATQGLGQGEQMATGIYHLLVTTFTGLLIAVPALIFYFYFQARIENLVAALNQAADQFLDQAFGTPESSAPAAPPERPRLLHRSSTSPAAKPSAR